MTKQLIKIVYRAQFQQPIGVLNPAGFRLAMPMTVEIFKAPSGWMARTANNGYEPYAHVPPQPTAGIAKQQIKLQFEAQLSAFWTMHELLDGKTAKVAAVPFTPADFGVDGTLELGPDDKVYRKIKEP